MLKEVQMVEALPVMFQETKTLLNLLCEESEVTSQLELKSQLRFTRDQNH